MMASDRTTLPESADIATFCALLFVKLGGQFSVSSSGRRCRGRPEPCLFRIQGCDLPQLPGASPWEQFQSEAEWEGAVKLLSYALDRMAETDRDLIYGAFAPVITDDRRPFDFREHLQ